MNQSDGLRVYKIISLKVYGRPWYEFGAFHITYDILMYHFADQILVTKLLKSVPRKVLEITAQLIFYKTLSHDSAGAYKLSKRRFFLTALPSYTHRIC